MANQPDFDPDLYPSLDLAYEYVLPSHDWAIRRLEAVEQRIDNLMTFAITVTVALTASSIALAGLADKPVPPVLDEPGYIAIALFLIVIIWGMFVRQAGEIAVIDPKVMFNYYLTKSPAEFRKDVLYYAGEVLHQNERTIRRKSWGANIMTVLFVIEIAAVFIWSSSLF